MPVPNICPTPCSPSTAETEHPWHKSLWLASVAGVHGQLGGPHFACFQHVKFYSCLPFKAELSCSLQMVVIENCLFQGHFSAPSMWATLHKSSQYGLVWVAGVGER